MPSIYTEARKKRDAIQAFRHKQTDDSVPPQTINRGHFFRRAHLSSGQRGVNMSCSMGGLRQSSWASCGREWGREHGCFEHKHNAERLI